MGGGGSKNAAANANRVAPATRGSDGFDSPVPTPVLEHRDVVRSSSPAPQQPPRERQLEEEVKRLRTQLAASKDKAIQLRRETLRRASFREQQNLTKKIKKIAAKKEKSENLEGTEAAHAEAKDRAAFEKFNPGEDGTISTDKLVKEMKRHGFAVDRDVRLADCCAELNLQSEFSFEEFQEIKNNCLLMDRALNGHLAIPNFYKFKQGVLACYKETIGNEGGDVARYIPSLARVNPDQYGVALLEYV